MEVRVSGCVFSSLFYELSNSKGDTEGLLLGQITSRTINTVTDTQSENVKHERVATVQGFIPFGKVNSFYDYVGCIKAGELSEEPNEDGKTQKVIGWYKFRRNSQSLVSMRERVVHHNLIKELSITPAKEFIFAVFTASMNKEMSSHKFDYCFCSSAHRKGLFEPIQAQVLNLGDTSHSEYRLNSSQATSSIFHEVIDSYRNDFVDENGSIQQTSNMHGMYITMMKKLQDLVEMVKTSETFVLSLSEEVDSRRKDLEDVRLQLASRHEHSDVNEKRPLQPSAVSDQSSKDSKDEKETGTNHSDPKTSAVLNGHEEDSGADDNNIAMEITQSNTSNEKQEELSNEQSDTKTGGSCRRRKQEKPGKVAAYVNDDDDDVTDDETQTYSLPENSEDSGHEEKNVEHLPMESLSPVF